MKTLILILTILLLVSCEKETVNPSKTTTTYSCTQKDLDLYKLAQDIKYCQSNLANGNAQVRQQWINRIDENRKKMDEISKKPCI